MQTSLKKVLEGLKLERMRLGIGGGVWYIGKPDSIIAMNIYKSITGKNTENFYWLKVDIGILEVWINALEAVCD